MIIQGNDPTISPSFSLQNRIMRQLWNCAWLLLFRPSPRPFHAWRAGLLRLFGAHIGKHVHVYPAVRIWAPWNLEIGNHVGVADGVTLYNMDMITIGDYSVISQGAHLCGGSHDYNSQNFQLMAAPITLQSQVWICAEAFVSQGVTLPTGAVIAARSVVTRSPKDAWTVYAGMPAKPIRKRTQHVK
ncbi:putative colanic acid biosynthesis acetyltransferase [Cupriavidus sp. KK10]|jgi:putative colanic acid biosynthesis acetyltransferase WcaF|uniref:putative colanic acid biosynthesis acetyltransferase n=1 Tax=Cupriavidus sp. KK10 TaxID=1478019 RepID=UPI001BAC4CF7|nr:putative colanic acid biosynthesis acetyltransferase [Cupriavidus sp. KK10]QUN30585.1 putative colanic acid biosynthesis acetyltransferase [Cupriavidus sp. KK10]